MSADRALVDPAPPERLSPRGNPPIVEFGFFLVLVVVVLVAVTQTGSFSLSNRDLVDTDGYMRYVRIEQLLETGAWFDSTISRSNFPLGDELHWTRPLDAFVLGLNLLLAPFLGEDSLYWAAAINAPLLLVVLGVAMYRAFGRYVEREARPLLMFGVVALPFVLSYSRLGRVDHHVLIMLLFVIVVSLQLRLLEEPSGRTSLLLGASLALGMWISTEFLIPWFLVAATLGVWHVSSGRRDVLVAGRRIFMSASLGTVVAVLVERGVAWSTIEYDRVSLVHVVIGAAALSVFVVGGLAPSGRSVFRRATILLVGAAVPAGILLALFPDLAGGPYVGVHPRVRELWLYEVPEVQSLVHRPWSTVLAVALPLAVGLGAGLGLAIRRGGGESNWLVVSVSWLAAYAALAVYQIRWVIYGHLLVLAVFVHLIGLIYRRLPGGRFGVVIRPLVVAGLLAVIVGSGLAVGTDLGGGDDQGVTCRLDEVAPLIGTGEVVLADQDDGPELLYRTDANVIATSYHRNSAGLLFLYDVMNARDLDQVQLGLRERRVDLILVCPYRGDFSRPADPDGTFYEALLEGPMPGFVRPVPEADTSGYRLFAVES